MKRSVIGIVLNENRTQVLCIKRRDVPIWVLPGGGVDGNETMEEAMVREIFEETGLCVKIARKIGEYTPINRLSYYTETFECKPTGGEIAIGSETAQIAFFDVQRLPKNFFTIHKEWLDDALQHSSAVIQKPIKSVTYWKLFLYFCWHPIWVLRLLLSRLGFPINK